MLGRFILHSSHYTIGSLLVTLASIVSFPIFTRTFSVADYGALNLISSLLLLWTGIGKMGVQQSIARYHAEVVAGKHAISEPKYIATILIGMGCTGAAATLGWALMSLVVPPAWWNSEQVALLLLPLSALIFIRVMDSAITNLLRAQQRSVLLNVFLVLRKYLGLAVILVLMFYVIPGLSGFYLGTFIVECVSVVGMTAYLVRKHKVRLSGFSGPTFRAMVAFGLPMIAFELSGIVLNLGDRYVIQAMLGGESLGHYSAAYNLCDYARVVIFSSFAAAITPIYIRLWEEKGEQATIAFIERALRLYFMIGVAVVAGMMAVGTDVLTLLASEKYAPGALVIPLVIAAMCIDGGTPIFCAGMYIFKQNHRIIPWVIFAAVANIALNVLLVPYLGLAGSAVATLVCYSLIAAAAWRIGSRQVRIRFPLADLCKFTLLAAIMYFAVSQVAVARPVVELLLRIVAGVVLYGLLIVAFDRQVRADLMAVKARFAV
jgi:O-antigen/teichoic acid export membrane protein